MNFEALVPVEPTPAVRKQLGPTICLGDLPETGDVEMSLTTRSLSLPHWVRRSFVPLVFRERGKINIRGVAEL
jgi:hypothetical protein